MMWINAEASQQKLDFIPWNKLLNFSGYMQEKNGRWLKINNLISVQLSYLYDKIPQI